jgi:TonB family protein
MSAGAKIRIENSGRVAQFELVRPSGNVVLDESIRAIAARVMQVDPLPTGVGNGQFYDVTINFELDAQ